MGLRQKVYIEVKNSPGANGLVEVVIEFLMARFQSFVAGLRSPYPGRRDSRCSANKVQRVSSSAIGHEARSESNIATDHSCRIASPRFLGHCLMDARRSTRPYDHGPFLDSSSLPLYCLPWVPQPPRINGRQTRLGDGERMDKGFDKHDTYV